MVEGAGTRFADGFPSLPYDTETTAPLAAVDDDDTVNTAALKMPAKLRNLSRKCSRSRHDI